MIQKIIKKYGLFISFILGGLASGFPTIFQDLFPEYRVWIVILFFLIGWIISFVFSDSSFKNKIYWTIVGVLFLGYVIYRLPSNLPAIEIISPNNYEEVKIEESTGLITIRGKIYREFWPRFDDNSLHVYVFKFDANSKMYFESTEPAKYEKGKWEKKLPFYENQNFKIIAIAATSPEIAKCHAILSKAYKSLPITFNTSK